VAEIIKASGKKYIKLKSSMIENSYLQINAGMAEMEMEKRQST
jgi:hypothetical protein